MLRALIGQASLILSDESEDVSVFRAVGPMASPISPARRRTGEALIEPWPNRVAPRYVRRRREIADQAILNSIRRAFGCATEMLMTHEAGAASKLRRAGKVFPLSFLDRVGPGK